LTSFYIIEMKDKINILYNLVAEKVIAKEIEYNEYVPLDLSKSTLEHLKYPLNTAHDYSKYIQNYLDIHNAKIAYGGYLEERNLYQRSTVFNETNKEERNIHIGLDLWINEAATVYAVLDGKIHSFQNNTALGDYGPTIILEHQVDNFTFYTLYGHLSLESISNIQIGQLVHKGESIGNLGMPPINGDYAPHLHFQIIMDIEQKNGDYPGVCSTSTVNFYKENCPDPTVLLKISAESST